MIGITLNICITDFVGMDKKEKGESLLSKRKARTILKNLVGKADVHKAAGY